MSIQNSVVAIYGTHTEADQAVKELQHGGILECNSPCGEVPAYQTFGSLAGPGVSQNV